MHSGDLAGIPPMSNLTTFFRPCPASNLYIPSDFNPQTSSLTNHSTSDEEHQQLALIDERKQRRMISNRESARRSRMRKQRHLDELVSRVYGLRAENRKLVDKLNSMSEYREKLLRENARYEEEASELRQKLQEMQEVGPVERDQIAMDMK